MHYVGQNATNGKYAPPFQIFGKSKEFVPTVRSPLPHIGESRKKIPIAPKIQNGGALLVSIWNTTLWRPTKAFQGAAPHQKQKSSIGFISYWIVIISKRGTVGVGGIMMSRVQWQCLGAFKVVSSTVDVVDTCVVVYIVVEDTWPMVV